MACESCTKFKFQCPHISFYRNIACPLLMYSLWLLLQSKFCWRSSMAHKPKIFTIWASQKKFADPWSKGRKESTIKPNSPCRFNEKFQANMAGEIVSVYVQTWNWDNRGRSTSLPSHLDSTFKCHQSVCALHDLQGLIINYSTRAPETIQGL